MRPIAAIVLTVVALAAGVWYLLTPADAAATVRARLLAFSEVVNSNTVDGQDPAVHSAQLSVFFTEDVEVDLGRGAVPILGRDTVLGMAERLQPARRHSG